jgi:hypothetical protein
MPMRPLLSGMFLKSQSMVSHASVEAQRQARAAQMLPDVFACGVRCLSEQDGGVWHALANGKDSEKPHNIAHWNHHFPLHRIVVFSRQLELLWNIPRGWVRTQRRSSGAC